MMLFDVLKKIVAFKVRDCHSKNVSKSYILYIGLCFNKTFQIC